MAEENTTTRIPGSGVKVGQAVHRPLGKGFSAGGNLDATGN